MFCKPATITARSWGLIKWPLKTFYVLMINCKLFMIWNVSSSSESLVHCNAMKNDINCGSSFVPLVPQTPQICLGATVLTPALVFFCCFEFCRYYIGLFELYTHCCLGRNITFCECFKLICKCSLLHSPSKRHDPVVINMLLCAAVYTICKISKNEFRHGIVNAFFCCENLFIGWRINLSNSCCMWRPEGN